jgi:small-conductance mechanosensitive channel
MNSKNASMFLCRALVFSIAVLMTGFLGLGLRVFAAAETTKSILFVAFAISVAILVLYLMLRGSTRELTAHSPDRKLSFVKHSLFPRLCTISANPFTLDHLSEKPTLAGRTVVTTGDSPIVYPYVREPSQL